MSETAEGIEFAVAITRLAKHGQVFRFFFALSISIFVFYSPSKKQKWHPSIGPKDRLRLRPRRLDTPECRRFADYTRSSSWERLLAKIGILIIEDDEANQSALRQLLDSEGWQVRVVPVVNQALAELSTGEWSLVIVNVAMIGLTSPVYLTLRELALAPAVEDGKVRARVLFVVPESASTAALPVFEREKLPYVVKPFQFHDLLEKVSDLLMEAAALANPIRRVRHDSTLSDRKRKEGREGRESGNAFAQRNTNMFAKRDEYVMTEEEIAEYEKTEKEERELKKKKNPQLNRY
jgi:DNA-binding response OmpR family regulator